MIRYGTKPRSGWIQREQEEVKRLGCGEEGALVEEHNPALYISVLMAAEMASVHEVLCQHRTLMEHLMRGHHPQPAEQGEQLREARRMHSWQSSVLLLASVFGQPSKQAVMIGSHTPLLEPQMDEHLLCSSQSTESLRPCLPRSVRPGPHPLKDQRRIQVANVGNPTGCLLGLAWVSCQLNHELLPQGQQRGETLQKGEEAESKDEITTWILPRVCPALIS